MNDNFHNLVRTSLKRRRYQIEKDELEENRLKREEELKEKREVINRLLQKVEKYEALKAERDENAEKLNILFQAGIIDEEGNIIKKDDM